MHTSIKFNSRRELVFFDETNRRSLVNLVPEAIAILIKKLWKSDDAYLLGMGETRLRGELIRRGKNPSVTDSRIRLQFWLEYDRAQDSDSKSIPKMDMAYVIGRQISKESFYTHYLTDPCALAWVICPPVIYETSIEEALREATEKLRLVIGSEHINKEGLLDQKFAQFLLRAEAALFDRHMALQKGSFKMNSKTKDETNDDGAPTQEETEEIGKAERQAKLANYRAELEERRKASEAATTASDT